MAYQRVSLGWLRALGAAPAMGLVFMLVVLPAGLLGTYAFRETTFAGVGPGPTLQHFETLARGGYFFRIVLRTVGVGLAVGTVVTVLAFVIAYGTRFRFSRRASFVILGLALAAGIASFLVRIYAWGTILGTEGLINSALQSLGVIHAPLGFLFFGYFSVIVTMSYLYLPIGVVVIQGAMQDVDPHSLEAGRDLGAGRWRTASQVILPQVRGAMTSCFVLVSVLASADYVTPALVGGTKGQMIGTVIRSQALASADLPGAAAIALAFTAILVSVLVAIVFTLALGRRLLRLSAPLLDRIAATMAAKSIRTVSRRSFSRPAAIALVVYLVFPTLVVLVFSLNNASNLGLPWKGFTLRWYGNVVQRPGFSDALSTSLKLVAISTSGAILIGTPVAFALSRSRGVGRAFLSAMTNLPFVVPGVLIGLGLLTVADALNIQLGLGTTAAAHVMLLLPIVVTVVSTRLALLNPELVQASRDLGATPVRAFRTVTLPLIAPSLVGAVLIGAAFSLDEIFVTTFTIGSNSTLPIWILSQARIGFDPGLNALGVMLVAATLIVPAVAFGAYRLVSSGLNVGASVNFAKVEVGANANFLKGAES